jgi:hypothetical protein
MSLTLLGVIHADPRGKERLERALVLEPPTTITLESRPSDVALYRAIIKKREELLQTLQGQGLSPEAFEALMILDVRAAFQEIFSPIEYGEKQGILVHHIEHPTFPLERSECEALMAPIDDLNFTNLTFEQNQIDSYYRLIYQAIRGLNETMRMMMLMKLAPSLRQEGLDRDDHPALRLRELVNNSDHVLHVCGAGHLLDDEEGRTLYSKIEDLHPVRKLAWEFDENFVAPDVEPDDC